ncbi:MAG: hypothetical protein JXA82_00710 [Sedimentisphaerales bacterium]|nr:hypothetical protein [Sedimentisphaerales bacterium]
MHAFIADGRLYFRQETGEIHEHESPFVSNKQEQFEHYQTHSGWKRQGFPQDPFIGPGLWGGQSRPVLNIAYRFQNVVTMDQHRICYTLTNNVVTGLFEYDLVEQEEVRLFHKNDFMEFGLDYSELLRQFVIATAEPDGRANLQLLDERGSHVKEITGGDSRDSHPTFCRSNPNHILFQSAGCARHEDGLVYAYGPEAIFNMDLVSGKMNEIIADDRHDYLLPRADRDGNIYCIRRPYQGPYYRSALLSLFHIVTFPIRFLIAIVNFLNAFTKLFSQNPLQPNGPAALSPPRNKYVHVLGQTIDLAKVKRPVLSPGNPSLVPGSWELLRIGTDKEIKTIAKNVCSYDIDEKGCLYYTNGYQVSQTDGSHRKTNFKHNIIEVLSVKKVEIQQEERGPANHN